MRSGNLRESIAKDLGSQYFSGLFRYVVPSGMLLLINAKRLIQNLVPNLPLGHLGQRI